MKTELLAPAASVQGLKAVINAGADAAYIGGIRFGARAYAENAGEEDLVRALDYAHLRDRKVYLTVNTLLKDSEIDELYDYMLPYYRAGIDAVLVQDFGVLSFLHEAFPDLPLHASTQMTVTGPKTAQLLAGCGITRVVPARELSLEELSAIRSESGLEVEVFVHGALCVCYSGQCLYSSFLGGRSGNRGRCAQPCRLLYLMDDRYFHGQESILEQPSARHYLSPKDLNLLARLPELTEAGIDSLKIEGRMKRPEYAAGVTSIYRKYLDLALSGEPYTVSAEDQRKIYDLYNRSGFTDGYLYRHNGPEMMAPVKHELTREETDRRHALYEEYKALFMDKDSRIPVQGALTVRTGEPSSFFLSHGGWSVRKEGPVPEKASGVPLSKEQLEKRAGKLGGTEFAAEMIMADTDGSSFLPVSALNTLRRETAEALRLKILSERRRDSEKPPHLMPYPVKENGSAELSALIRTEEQLDAVLGFGEVREVEIESSLILSGKDPLKEALRLIRKVRRNGVLPTIAMPYIEREGNPAGVLADHYAELAEEGLHRYLVRSFETFSDMVFMGLGEKIRTDCSLYAFNRYSASFIRSLGAAGMTAPLEWSRREFMNRPEGMEEAVIYGYLPLMVTAQCLQKNTGSCTREGAVHTLTDRMGIRFRVISECVFCYNIIYNSLPLALFGELGEISSCGFRLLRLQFTSEPAEETKRLLMKARDALRGALGQEEAGFTRGHYRHGVE